MNTPMITLLTAALLLTLLNLRAMKIKDWRAEWRTALKDDPAGISYFATHVPKFDTMLWKFWKPVKDSAWMSADVRAAKYRAQLSPENRKKLDRYMKTQSRKSK